MLLGTFLEMISISLLVPLLGLITLENNRISEIIINYNLDYLSSFLELNKVVYFFVSVFLCKNFFFFIFNLFKKTNYFLFFLKQKK